MDEEKLTMADFEDEINASFVKFRPGQAIKGTVVAIDEDEIALDLQSYSRGIIPKEEWSNDPDFHAMDEIRIGDMLTVIVLYEDESGQTITSLRQAKEVAAWETLQDALANHTIFEVKIKEVVPSGVITYLEGIRTVCRGSGVLRRQKGSGTGDHGGRRRKPPCAFGKRSGERTPCTGKCRKIKCSAERVYYRGDNYPYRVLRLFCRIWRRTYRTGAHFTDLQ